jgi:ribosomal protein S18 acetylase RimI-like enzyme
MPPSGDPSGSRVAVRGARIDEAETLERIEADCFESDRLSRRSLNHHLRSDTADVFIAELGRAVAGYAMVFYRANASVARLYSIATLPEFRGRGVADALMDAAERAARKRGCSALRLEVRFDNPAATALYVRRGYAEFGSYADYYADGMSARRFQKDLAVRSKRAA